MIAQTFDARGDGTIGVGNDGEEGDVQILGVVSDAWINRSTLNGVVDERFRLKLMEQFHSMRAKMGK